MENPNYEIKRQSKRNGRRKKNIIYDIAELIIWGTVVFLVLRFMVISFVVSGPSMEPTYYTGDRGIMLRINNFNKPDYNDIVVVKHDESLIIKRLFGLPGDTVEIKENNVYINGEVVPDENVKDKSKMAVMPKLTLGSDEYFVLGDNRDESSDSRLFGPVHENDLIGVNGVQIWPLNEVGFLK